MINAYLVNNQNYLTIKIIKAQLGQHLSMQNQSINNIMDLLNKFIQINHSSQSIQSQILLLTQIKKAIINNPNNYYHQVYGRVPFQNIYEFVIDCISRQQHDQVIGFLLHVLALMSKFWLINAENLKRLYEGILSVFQQRPFCKQNCFRYFTTVVQTMQENSQITQYLQLNDKISHFSSTPIMRSNFQNYFVYHLLNQMLAFANIFLDRCIVRNDLNNQNSQRQIKSSRISQQNSRSRQSFSFKNTSNQNSQEQSSIQEHSQQCQLYKIQQKQSVIFSILSLIRACLSYDFSHTSRHEQQSQYQPHKSPIILPTKYSKYCKFSQYDIFLKSQNTTQMLNYLFLVSNTIQLKIQILKILQAMARIHFRYFKNKTYHKLHLEDIGYVVGNLLTGLDLEQAMSASIRGSLKTTFVDTRSKVIIAVTLGEIVSILLYHQPTFYLVQNSLMEMIIQHLHTFIVDQILDPQHFNPLKTGYKSLNSLSICDLCLLIETFMSPFVKLKDFMKNYLNTNEIFKQKINQLFIKVGQKYFKILNIMNNKNTTQKQTSISKSQWKSMHKKTNRSSQLDKYNTNSPIPQQSSLKIQSNNNKISKLLQDQQQCNIDSKSQPISNHDNQQIQNQETQTNFKMIQKNYSTKIQSNKTKPNISFIQWLFQQSGTIDSVRNVLAVFKVYCPKHAQLNQLLQNQNKGIPQRINITNSDISFKQCNSMPQSADIYNYSFDRKSERMSQKLQDSQKQRIQINYQKWMISWLCNFQNHFNVTAGHCRHSKDWQMQLHQQLMSQLIIDLNSGMIRYIKFQKQQKLITNQSQVNNMQDNNMQENRQLGQCIKIILLYVIDKIVNDCRIGCQQYINKVNIKLMLILQWITEYVYFMGTVDPYLNTYSDKIYQMMCILDFINNIKIQNYVTTPDSLNTEQKQNIHQKLQKNKQNCINCIESLLATIQKLSITNQNKQNYLFIDKLLYILLKFYTALKILLNTHPKNICQSQQQEQCKQQIILHQKLQSIFLENNRFQLLTRILTQTCEQINLFSSTFFHNSCRKINYTLYDLIRDEWLMFYYPQKSKFRLIKDQNTQQFIHSVKCFGLILKMERKTHHFLKFRKQSIVEVGSQILQRIVRYLNDVNFCQRCQCSEYIEQSLSICQQLYIMNLLPNEGLIKQLLQNIEKHRKCLKQQQISKIQIICTLIINILYLLTSNQISCNHDKNNSYNIVKQKNIILCITQTVIWFFQFLTSMFQIYSYNQPILLKIQCLIMQYVENRDKGSGVIRYLQDFYKQQYQYECIQGNYAQDYTKIQTNSIQKIVTALCKYLSARTQETIYITSTSSQDIQPTIIKIHKSIRVDNMILIFSLYHQIWEYLHHQFNNILYSVLTNQVLISSIKYMERSGVGWVIRKLQQWNLSQFQQMQRQIQIKAQVQTQWEVEGNKNDDMGDKKQVEYNTQKQNMYIYHQSSIIKQKNSQQINYQQHQHKYYNSSVQQNKNVDEQNKNEYKQYEEEQKSDRKTEINSYQKDENRQQSVHYSNIKHRNSQLLQPNQFNTFNDQNL